jgi:hypothetical protein
VDEHNGPSSRRLFLGKWGDEELTAFCHGSIRETRFGVEIPVKTGDEGLVVCDSA